MPGVNRLARQRLSQRVEVVREDRDNIDLRIVSPAPADPRAGRSRSIWSASDTAVTMALTNGTSTSRRRRYAPRAIRLPRCAVPRRRCRQPCPSVVTHPQPFELMVVELVGILDRRQVRRSRRETACPATTRRRRGRRPRPAAPAAGPPCVADRLDDVARSAPPRWPAAQAWYRARSGCRGRRCGPRRRPRR